MGWMPAPAAHASQSLGARPQVDVHQPVDQRGRHRAGERVVLARLPAPITIEPSGSS